MVLSVATTQQNKPSKSMQEMVQQQILTEYLSVG